MIALITCVIVIISLITASFIIKKWKVRFWSLIISFWCIITLVISYCIGYNLPNTFEKYIIENELEQEVSVELIERALNYNKRIDFGNNLWCRFSIEDRNEYKIDIQYYIDLPRWRKI